MINKYIKLLAIVNKLNIIQFSYQKTLEMDESDEFSRQDRRVSWGIDKESCIYSLKCLQRKIECENEEVVFEVWNKCVWKPFGMEVRRQSTETLKSMMMNNASNFEQKISISTFLPCIRSYRIIILWIVVTIRYVQKS